MESDEDLDLLFVTYDAGKIRLDQLKATIAEYGFEAVLKE